MKTLRRALLNLGIPLDYLLSLIVVTLRRITSPIATGDLFHCLVFGGTIALIPIRSDLGQRDLANFTDSWGMHTLDSTPPAGVVGFIGWLFLLGLIGLQAYETL
ncbi:MAG: hypothetical protein AAF483_10730 [Planctomycetota bacterium]